MRALRSGPELLLVKLQHALIEAREDDAFDVRVTLDSGSAFPHRDRDCIGERIAINAAADRREREGANTVLRRKGKARAIARSEQLGLAVPAVAIDGTDGVDHVTRRQPVASGDARLAR